MTIRVPEDAATLAAAADRVGPGGTIVIAPGIYAEELVIDPPDITVRGEDRNATVIDGEAAPVRHRRDRRRREHPEPDGSHRDLLRRARHRVHADDGCRPRTAATGYTSARSREVPAASALPLDHVTAYNNGLYGIYAFDAQHGVIRDSYASGSADSGFYVGQCRDCDILVQGNVAERNAIGFENANASDSVVARRATASAATASA